MRKNLFYVFALVCSMSLFTACSDDDDSKFPKDEVNATYTSTDASNQLQLLYSGEPMLGKSATFNTTDGKTATIVLKGVATSLTKMNAASSAGSGVIPGEPSTTLDVILNPVGGTGYTFKGKDENTSRTIEFEGSVEAGKLVLQLNVTIANDLVGTWELYSYDPYGDVFPIRTVWDSNKNFELDLLSMGFPVEMEPGGLLAVMSVMELIPVAEDKKLALQGVMTALLKNVTFRADGNIQASYSEAANLANPVWKQSPLNLVQYSVKDGKIYLYLNVDAILATVVGNQPSTKVDISTILPQLMELLPMVYNGIPLGYFVNENGRLSVYLEKDLGVQLLTMLLPLLKDEELLATIMESVNSNPDFAMFAGVVVGMLEQLPGVVAGTTNMELGLNFHSAK